MKKTKSSKKIAQKITMSMTVVCSIVAVLLSFVISGIPLPFSSLWCYGQARDSWEALDTTIPSDHFPLTVIIPVFGLVQRLDFASISIVRRVAALTPRLTLS